MANAANMRNIHVCLTLPGNTELYPAAARGDFYEDREQANRAV